MKVYRDIEQGVEEWFELKWGKIGGTRAKGLFTESEVLFMDLLSEKIEEFEVYDSFSSEAAERGKELEPFALKYLSKYIGVDFKNVGWMQSEYYELLGLSPDGVTDDFTIAAEVKCLGAKKHTEILLTQEIPKEHIHQCIHYFTVNPRLKKLYFIAFRPESCSHFIKELTRSNLVDLGLKEKKEVEVIGKRGVPIKPKTITVPKLITINKAVNIMEDKANSLLNKINQNYEKLLF